MKLLLSIKREYSEKIFSGEKKYEFRKQKPKGVINKVFVYECSPSKNIVGWFSVKSIHAGSPEEIWERCKNSGGIGKSNYLTYCNGTKVIYAFEIDETSRFDNPIDPFEIIADFKPPQSFAYLDGSVLFNTLENC
jgi:predicted transcriptional regulator